MKRIVKINKEAKEYLLNYIQDWLDGLSKHTFSYRIVQEIYNKVDSMPVE